MAKRGEYMVTIEIAEAATYSLGDTGSQFTASLDESPEL